MDAKALSRGRRSHGGIVRAPRTTGGVVLIVLGGVGLAQGVFVGTSPSPLFSTIAAGRLLAAASAVPLGFGVASAILGVAYELVATERWGGMHPASFVTVPVGLVLGVWALLMVTAPVCPGISIDYMGPNGVIVAQRCLDPLSPFPVAAVGIAFLGGLVGGTIVLPRWRIAPFTPPHAVPRRGR